MSAVRRSAGASAAPTAAMAATAASSRPAATRGAPEMRAGRVPRAAAVTAAARNHAVLATKNTTFPVSSRPIWNSSSRRSGSIAKPRSAIEPGRSAGAARATAIHTSQRKTVRRYAATWFPTRADIRIPDAA